jgi:hypothetical protein
MPMMMLTNGKTFDENPKTKGQTDLEEPPKKQLMGVVDPDVRCCWGNNTQQKKGLLMRLN